MIPSRKYPQDLSQLAGDVASKLWNGINTAIGCLWGMVGVPLGAKVTFGNNAIQFQNHPFMPWGAITIGNTISYPPDFGPNFQLPNGTVGDHERQHTYQGEMLGPFYLPVNAVGGLWSCLTAGNWHDNNFMETGPRSTPPRPF